MRQFWPASEPPQVDYETLRDAAVRRVPLVGVAAGRFARRGLAGLIASPASEAEYEAVVLGAQRPPWTPYADPRLEVLAATYELILTSGQAGPQNLLEEVG